MARVAEALKIGHIELRAAPIDRNDMVDDLCKRRNTTPLALLAKRTLLQLQVTELPPSGRLIKLRVRIQASLLHTALRLPRALYGFLECWHKSELHRFVKAGRGLRSRSLRPQ